MAQVKFYSVGALPATASTTGTGGVYFVDNGELYKGAQRFGLARVTSATSAAGLAALTSKARGDINVGYEGAKVWDGSEWKALGPDISALTSDLQSSWRSDISTWTSGLKVTGADGTSYVTYISQDSDGKVTAHTENFATKVKEAIGDGSVSGSANGIKVDVVTTSGKVTSVSVSAPNISATNVSATTGSFTNLTVTDTATFDVTTVSASALSVDGVAVNNIAASSATGGTEGVAVTVSTANGGVKGVTVALTKASLNSVLGTTNVADKSVATTVRASASALDTALPTELAVRTAIDTAIGNMGQVMHFAGAGTSLPTSAKAGDVYVFTGDGSGYKAGQEVVYKGDNGTYASTNWEVIGDQNSYAVNAYAPGTEQVTAGTTTLPNAVHAIAGAVDTLNTNASLKASIGTGTATSSYGVTGQVVLTANAQPTFSLTVTPVTASADITAAATTSLATAAAIANYVTGKISALDASVSSSNQAGLTVSVVEADGVITGVQAELVWLDANGAAI